MPLYTLRLRGPSGASTLQLSDTSTLLELRAAILSITDIPAEKQELRAGVPPKPLDVTKGDSATLHELGLRSGDVIVVQEGKGSRDSVTSPPAGGYHAPLPPTVATSKASPFPSPLSPSSGPRQTGSRPLTIPGANPSSSASSNSNKTPLQPPVSPSKASAPLVSSLQRNPNHPANRDFLPTSPDQNIQPGQAARNERPQQPTLPPFTGLSTSGAKPGLTSTEDANVRVDGGWMVLRVVPDDNSCMFTSLAIVLEHDRPGAPGKLRQAVAEQIKRDPFTWSEPVLGMSPATYADKMVKNTTWGGAIELAIISDLYKVEIDSVDVQSGRVDKFGEEKQYDAHVFLIYSGIHYDAVTFTPMEPEPSATYPYSLDFDQTQFSKTGDAYALAATQELAKKLKDRRYYTDTAGFALRCEVCREALKGEKEAQNHAKRTGHTSFGEY